MLGYRQASFLLVLALGVSYFWIRARPNIGASPTTVKLYRKRRGGYSAGVNYGVSRGAIGPGTSNIACF